jgi:hypothetical protein
MCDTTECYVEDHIDSTSVHVESERLFRSVFNKVPLFVLLYHYYYYYYYYYYYNLIDVLKQATEYLYLP